MCGVHGYHLFTKTQMSNAAAEQPADRNKRNVSVIGTESFCLRSFLLVRHRLRN